MPVTSQIADEIGLIIFSNPPLNPISATAQIPQAIVDELDKLRADPSVRAVVLASEGKMFSAGADINEFNNAPVDVSEPIRGLAAALDSSNIPIVAAIQGTALGGGFEIALGCDYRVIDSDARLGLPEINLGVIPGCGGTQRLPRLVGGKKAAEMIASAAIIPAEEALASGLADRIAVGDLREAAIAFAREIAPKRRRRSRDLPVNEEGMSESIAMLRASLPGGGRAEAVTKALDAIEAGVADGFDQGLETENRIFDKILSSESARALRHAFISERAAARVPGIDSSTNLRKINRVAIIGAGTMGVGISLAVVQAGLNATVVDLEPEAIERARSQSRASILRNVEKGRLKQAQADEQIARLFYSTELADVSGHELVIEAVFEEMSIKKQVFETLDQIADEGAILASNTSTLDLDQIANFTSRPQDVVGLHFFSPANLMKLLEVVRGARTSDETLVTAMGFARQIRKVGVVAGVCDGFIGNRMFEEYLRQAYFLLEEGASPHQIDGAMERWGMAMGPLRTMDLAGQDIGWNIRKRRAVEQPDRPYSRIPDLICERGWFGQKSGRGYYIYSTRSKPEIDPEVEAIILAESDRLGVKRRDISEEEIVDRCLFALANEGAKLLKEGVAARPLDIDAVWMNGYGFPRFRGGPMFYADRQGVSQVVARMDSFAQGYQGWTWEVAPVLRELAESGESLSLLNGIES